MTSGTERIKVPLSNRGYEIVLGGPGIRGLGVELINHGIKEGTKILIVSNNDVAKYYGEICIESLSKNGFNPKMILINAGEKEKNINNIVSIHDSAFSNHIERTSIMVALGGGIVGDITGFAAATWLRGISFIQIPTTLLAMVDASIGGKTGVNHPKGKNLIGAFHQPKLVLIDPLTLNSLPDREFKCGMAEVIKYGIIDDKELFLELEKIKYLDSPSKYNEKQLATILRRSVSSKAKIVAEDEYESGRRAILNYGHTFGHAIETLCGYGNYLHGEAVGIGMIAAGELAVQLGIWSRDSANRQKALIAKTGLPTYWPKLNPNDVWDTLQSDKKVRNGKVRFILPKKIGEVDIYDDISKEQVIDCISKLN